MSRNDADRYARLELCQLEDRETPATGLSAFGSIAGGTPLVELARGDGTVIARFEAFEDSFRGGVRAAVAELDGNPNTAEIVAVPGAGGGPVVKVFSVDIATGAFTQLASFLAYEPEFRDGLTVAAGNMTGDPNRQQIVVGADAGGGPRVRIFDLFGTTAQQVPGPLGNFFAYEPDFRGGVRVAAGELDGNLSDGDELIVGTGPGGAPRVRVFRSDGAVLSDRFVGDVNSRAGVDVGFVSAGGVGQVTSDQLGVDFSQRNVDLNTAAVIAAGVTTTATVNTPFVGAAALPTIGAAGLAAGITTGINTGLAGVNTGLTNLTGLTGIGSMTPNLNLIGTPNLGLLQSPLTSGLGATTLVPTTGSQFGTFGTTTSALGTANTAPVLVGSGITAPGVFDTTGFATTGTSTGTGFFGPSGMTF